MEPRISIVTLGVADMERSYRFYHEGLGLPTSGSPEAGIVFFQTRGTCLAIYPVEKLAEDVSPERGEARSGFPGFTLAHNTRAKNDVDAILQQAKQAGGRIEKPAADAFWGGYSGYFSDPDGYLWEVAYSDQWKFNADGSLVIE